MGFTKIIHLGKLEFFLCVFGDTVKGSSGNIKHVKTVNVTNYWLAALCSFR